MSIVENPKLSVLDEELQKHPRVAALIKDLGTRDAALAAIRFFVWAEHPISKGMPSAEVNRRKSWLSPDNVTWRDIRNVFCQQAAVVNARWIETDSNDHTAFKTENYELRTGDVFEIRGVERQWWATGSMGKPQKCQAIALSQVGRRFGDFPSGHQEWRLIASSAQFLDQRLPNHPLFVEVPSVSPAQNMKDRPNRKPESPNPPQPTETSGLIERSIAYLKKHPVGVFGAFLVTAVTALGALTDGLDKIITFMKKYWFH